MSDHFTEIEEHRDLTAGIEYEDSEREWPDDEDAYEPDDPKHPTYFDRLADLWDMREGK